MGQDSALWGEPPLTQHDKNIMIGLFGSTKPPKKVPITEPGDRGPGIIIGLSFAIGIIFIVTVARLMTRIFRKGQVFGADDWMIIPAITIVIAYFSTIIARVPYACAGKHIDYCTYKEFGLFIEIGGIGQVLFFAASALIKISMTLFNRRLTGLTSKNWQIFHYSILAMLVIWFFISLFINIFQCQPVTAFFNFSLQADTPSYHCLDSDMINEAFVIVNAITDFCLLSVPIIVILRVRMRMARKLRMMAVFSLGLICCICSIVRIMYIFIQTPDVTWVFPHENALTIVDLFFGSIVASLPALNAFAEVAWARTKSYYSSRGMRSSQANGGSGSGSGGRSLGLGSSTDRSKKSTNLTSMTGTTGEFDDTAPSLGGEGGGIFGPQHARNTSDGAASTDKTGGKAPGVIVTSASAEADSFYTEGSAEDEEERIGVARSGDRIRPDNGDRRAGGGEKATGGYELKEFH